MEDGRWDPTALADGVAPRDAKFCPQLQLSVTPGSHPGHYEYNRFPRSHTNTHTLKHTHNVVRVDW
jgi:hypothetical protein